MRDEGKGRGLLSQQIQRMDFLVEWGDYDPASRTMGMRMIPDPRRYELREIGGRSMYFDRFTDTAIALETLVEAFNARGEPVPIRGLPPLIDSISDYAARRLEALRIELGGGGARACGTTPASQRAVRA